MEIAVHIDAVGREAKSLAAAAEQGGLEVEIEGCPGWNMRDLVRHLAEIHLWAAARVDKRTDKLFPDDISEHVESWPDLAVFWPDDDDLVGWYLETNANLVQVLEAAPADLDCPTFLPAPSPLAMWARRQAHETAVHRFDAEHAAGITTDFDPAFASDGIDELLTAFAPRRTDWPVEKTERMMVHATDTDDQWVVTMAPDGITTVREGGPADVTLTGTATDLYLNTWNRIPDSAVAVVGNTDVLDTWHGNNRVRWFT
ncbi:MAG: maleylpyruvate isomerase family mycothiol-dependent enzyme [Acidimicrobiia bacterium]